jgi:NADPH2:quinone reductase
LAATGKGRILRKYPLNGGIDFSGTVIGSEDSRYRAGDPVLVCGAQLSEVHDGGYSEVAGVPGGAIVPLPGSLSLRDASNAENGSLAGSPWDTLRCENYNRGT